MRTLGTQVRLRRLLRHHGEALERLRDAGGGGDREAALASQRRLTELVADVRSAWSSDLAVTPASRELTVFDGYVRRSLKALDATTAEYSRGPSGERLRWLAAQFHGTAVPLLLFLRGLEDTPAELLDGWLAPVLAKSA